MRPHFRALFSVLFVVTACSDTSGPKIGPPAALTVVSGSGQTGVVGTALSQPAVVKVTDSQGQAVEGVSVTFNVAAGGGSVSPASALTNATGTATTVWTLGTSASAEQKLEARAAGVTAAASFTATAQAGAPANLTKAAGDAQTGPVGQALGTELAVRVADQFDNPISGATVTWNVVSGGGSVSPSSSQTGADGVARTRWTLGGSLAGQQVAAFVSGVAASVTFGATGAPGAVATITLEPTSALIGVGATRQFVATMKDAFTNAITGRAVTWTSSDNSIATVDANGLARGVGAGAAQITASAEGKTAAATLTVQAGTVLSPVIAGVSPSVLTAGQSAIVTGSNFAATVAGNAVSINGVTARVTAATPTQLTIDVPNREALGCQPTRNLNLVVDVSGNAATRSVAVATASQRTLARGEFLNLTGDEMRCNELGGLGAGRYVIAVANVNENAAFSTGFTLRGGAAAAGLTEPVVASTRAAFDRALSPEASEARRQAAAHERINQGNLNLIRSMPRIAPEDRPNTLNVSAKAPPPNVGDTLTIRMANPLSPSCTNFQADIRARVVYVGTRGVVLEDVAAPLAGTMDSLYRAVGTEFDATMYPILATNFGDPLQFDASLDNNERFFMVFTKRVNDVEGIAGYVLSTDFYPKTVCTSSNQGEIFYARVPTVAGSGFSGDTPAQWLRRTRTVIIHEVKHIVSFADRFRRANGSPTSGDFEHRWLEEASAMVAEELWARQQFGYAQRGNVTYRQSLFCEVRPTGGPEGEQTCVGKPYSMFDHMLLLHDYEWEVEIRSPLGPTASDDFTYYGSGWAFLRWAIDHYGTSESAFLRALTSEPSLRGTSNLAARTGQTAASLLTDFTLALALDDRAGFSTTRTQHTMPSWNLPNIFNGMATDFGTQCNGPCFLASPLASRPVVYGDFNVAVPVLRGGSVAVFELSGTQVGKQLVELSATGGGTPNGNLRFSIVRVE